MYNSNIQNISDNTLHILNYQEEKPLSISNILKIEKEKEKEKEEGKNKSKNYKNKRNKILFN